MRAFVEKVAHTQSESEILQTNANFRPMRVSLRDPWLVQLTKWLLPQFEDCREYSRTAKL